ncbi:uncharacterized protein [Montipora capricornis]|uniref:uncharacterized protein n=1 Tax=Montipora capricornis TaxID=246305 RepID=UPI0035F17235
MPLNISNFFVTGTNPFFPKLTTETVGGQKSVQEVRSEGAVENEDQHLETQKLKLPSLTRKTTVTNALEDDDLQVLLRVRCFDFPLQVQGLLPAESTDEWARTGSFTNTSPVSSAQNHDDSSTGKEENGEITISDNKSFSPLSPSTVLEGLKVNLLGKQELNTESQRTKKDDEEEVDNYSDQTDSGSQEYTSEWAELVYRKSGRQVDIQPPKSDKYRISDHVLSSRRARKSLKDKRESRLSFQDSRSSIVPLKSMKQLNRQTLHLPKADKYDINPRNIVEVKVCSVFKGSVLKSMLIYSGFNDSWVPNRDGRLIKNAVFKAIMQQPGMFLRQPSPEEGVPKTWNHRENLLPKLPSLPVETVSKGVRSGVKKLVVKLPPIY